VTYYHWLGASADAETGSHPTDQARSGLGAPRFDPARRLTNLIGNEIKPDYGYLSRIEPRK
jgi:hypothetical protein